MILFVSCASAKLSTSSVSLKHSSMFRKSFRKMFMLIIQHLIIKNTAKIIKIPPNPKRAWRAVLPNLALYLFVSVLLFCCRRWGIVSIWRSYSNFTYHNKWKLHLLQIPLFLLRQNSQCFS